MSESYLGKISALFFNLIDTLLSVIKIMVWSKPIRRCKIELSPDKTLFLLANGPSLTKSLKDINEKIVLAQALCVNDFAVSDLYEKICPNIYVIVAPEYWIDDVDEIYKKTRKVLFDCLEQKTSWPLVLCVPVKGCKSKRIKQLALNNPNISLYFYNSTPVEGFDWFSFLSFRLSLGMPRPHNVLIPSLMIAINIGYKKIFLLGADHSWLGELFVSDDNKAFLSQKHFYDEKETKPATMKLKGKGERRLFEILHKFYLTFRNYFVIEKYARKRGVNIYNATKNSFIDAFERKYI